MNKIICLLFPLLIFIGPSCKKYEDGPWISLHSRQKRIEGDWKLNQLLVDGADSTALIYCDDKDSCPYFMHIFLSVKETETYGVIGRYRINGKVYLSLPLLNFSSNKRKLIIGGVNGGTTKFFGPIFMQFDKVEWEIQRLSMNELWIKTVYGTQNKTYEVKLDNIHH
jgi:hypothetical protein